MSTGGTFSNMKTSKLECPRGWQYTATNILGKKRETMNKNVLHQRPILGRSNTYCQKLPSPTYTYGAKSVRTGGVPEALCWSDDTAVHQKSSDHVYLTRDFVALNRESVRQGVTTSKEMTHFRALHDKLRPKHAKRRSRTVSPKPRPDITYGMRYRPSTPIEEVLAYKYQDDWINEQMNKLERLEAKLAASKTKKFNHPDTNALIRRNCIKKDKEESFWKMKRFEQNAVGRVDTFRSEECRKLAFEKDRSSKVSQTGLHGHGIQRTGECA